MATKLPGSIDPAAVGERLVEARKARGMTQAQVAEALGVARTTITAMEQGERRPRAGELIRLAELFGRQVGELTRPLSPQRLDSFVVQFRAARGVSRETDTKRDADASTFQGLCEDYIELERLLEAPLPRRYPAPYDIASTDPERAAAEVAGSERNRLGLGDGPIGEIWGVLEAEVGLRIFAPRFASRAAGMFVYAEAWGGCIAVNGNHPEERRRWTVAHEYAHFLVDRGRPEITVLPSYRRVPEAERFADAFARVFLMPEDGLTRHFNAMKRAKSGPVTPADVLALCHRYRVSFSAMTLRLEELRLLPGGTWDKLRDAGFKPDAARGLVEVPRLVPELPTLPWRYQLLAVQAHERGLLSEEQLMRFLRSDRVGARRLIQQLTEAAPDYDAGAWHQVPLDLNAVLAGAS